MIQSNYVAQNRNTNFTGLYESTINGLRVLVTNPTLGAMGIDFGTMGIPRPAVEFKERGFDAGVEPAIRENTSATNNALIGIYGVIAANMLAGGFNNKYAVKGNKILTNNDTIDMFSGIFKDNHSFAPESRGGFASEILTSIRGYNPIHKDADKEGFVSLSKDAKEQLTAALKKIFANENADYKPDKNDERLIKSIITSDTGAESSFKLDYKGKSVSNSLENFINDAYSLSKAFTEKELLAKLKGDVPKGFEEFIKDLKGLKTRSGMLGIAIPAAIGVSLMPINIWLTKKRTGKQGFVGVENKEKDNSTGFLGMKLASTAAILGFSWWTIGKSFNDISKKLQFTGKLPNISQFKFIYGVVIASRILSSRDKNELRETVIKDPLGFINWLILGGVVSKITANALGKNLINYSEKGKGFWNWITKCDIKTYDEVIMPVLKEKLLDKTGKLRPFKELLKELPQAEKIKVRNIAIAQCAGYLYSGIALGWGITKLNIFLTKKFNKPDESSTNEKIDIAAMSNADKNSPFNAFAV